MIKKIILKNLRLHKNLELNFERDKILIYGENAVGKTTVLEAIYYAFTTRSFKTSNIADLIKKDEIFFKIVLEDDKNIVETIFSKDNKNIYLNKNHIKKVSDFVGLYPVVAFTNLDFNLLNLNPQTRREYFDFEIMQFVKKYSSLIIKYKKILKQRNLILKNITHESDLTFFNVVSDQLIELASEIIKIRTDYIDSLNYELSRLECFKNLNVFIKYESDVQIKNLEKAFKKNFKKEIEYKQTLNGIQKDDYKILLNDEEIKKVASNGEMQLSLLKIKYAILSNLIKNDKNPIFLIDDITNMLDSKNIEMVFNTLIDNIQIIISSVKNLENDKFMKIEIKR